MTNEELRATVAKFLGPGIEAGEIQPFAEAIIKALDQIALYEKVPRDAEGQNYLFPFCGWRNMYPYNDLSFGARSKEDMEYIHKCLAVCAKIPAPFLSVLAEGKGFIGVNLQ